MSVGRFIASGVFGAALVLGVAASPATAADGTQRAMPKAGTPAGGCLYEDWWAKVCFEPVGEWFWLLDKTGASSHFAVEWEHWTSSGVRRHGVIYNDHGPAGSWTAVNKSFEEGLTVVWRVCDYDVPSGGLSWCSGGNVSPT
ncbi:hypothetical protein ACIBCM_33595 [Streptomyces sp. NPDC051018]|uniref:hypothetical protein n=1 Tax=Streptomyces sp. NPDC051018 TaxID=3365639 RepID=UPI0037A97938